MVTSGEIRRPVIIQRPVGTVADFGQGSDEWEDYRECWARILPLAGGERAETQQLTQQTTHQIKLRNHPDKPINSNMIVVSGTRRFQIRSVINTDEVGAELVLMVDEMHREYSEVFV